MKWTHRLVLASATLVLDACGGGGGGDGGGGGPGGAPPPSNYTVGGQVSGLASPGLVLQNNRGDDLTLNADGAFAFATSLAPGARYDITVRTAPRQPLHRCSVANGSGTVNAAPVIDIAVSCVPVQPRYAYIANEQDNSVSIFAIDGDGGRLQARGYARTGKAPRHLALAPSNARLYLAAGMGIEVYNVDAASGQLSRWTTFIDAAAQEIGGLGIDPSGRFLFALRTNSVAVYALDANTGTPQAVAGSPFAMSGATPQALAFAPSGRHVYVASFLSAQVLVHAIDPSSGALSALPVQTFATGSQPGSMALDAGRGVLYVTHQGGVSGYAIDAASGALAPLAGSPFDAGPAPDSLALDPSGRYAYVTNLGNGTVTALTIGANGALARQAGPPVTVDLAPGSNPVKVDVEPSGRFAYVHNGLDTIAALAIDDATGALSPIARGAKAYVRDGLWRMAFSSGPTALRARSQYAYVANLAGDSIGAFRVQGDGSLLPLAGSPLALPAGSSPRSVRVDPHGRFLAVALIDRLATYAIDPATGALTPRDQSAAVGSGAIDLALDSSGRRAYLTFDAPTHRVQGFDLDASGAIVATDGRPSQTTDRPFGIVVDAHGRTAFVGHYGSGDVLRSDLFGPTPAPGDPWFIERLAGGVRVPAQGPAALALAENDTSLYVANDGAATLTALRVGNRGGLTSGGADIATGARPLGVAADPAGRFVYVANFGSNNISAYRRAAGTGVLTAVAGSPFAATGFSGPRAIAVDASGRFVYTANFGFDGVSYRSSVSAYEIDTGSGALQPRGAAVSSGGNEPHSIAVSTVID